MLDQLWRRFRRDLAARLSLAALSLLALAAALAPLFAPDPNRPDLYALEQPPSHAHLLGTDAVGRDVFARLLYGGRVSLAVGLAAVLVALVVGVGLGLAAGTLGGLADGLIMRLSDVVHSFPFLPLAVGLAAVIGPGLGHTVALIGLLSWPGAARLVRAECLALREAEYVQAAIAAGAGRLRIALWHLLPAALPPALVWASLNVGGAMLAEAGLSFLGLGVTPPTASWGNMLTAAQSLRALRSEPWLWLPPGLAIFIAVTAVNLCGDALRDALDPRFSPGLKE